MSNIVKSYTWEEFLTLQKKQKHSHVGLYNLDGSRVVAYNPNSKPVAPKLEEIKLALDNPTLADGVYLIKAKASLSPKSIEFDYPIIKGNPDTATVKSLNENGNANDMKTEGFEPNVTSYSKVLELNIELERLKIENQTLAKENAELTELLDQFEHDDLGDEDEPNDFLSNAGTFLESLMPMVSPIVDKHYELKERLINLEEQKLKVQARKVESPKNQKPDDDSSREAINETDKRIQEFINGHNEDQQTYEKMASVYNQAETLDDFYDMFGEQLGEDKLDELTEYINGESE